MKIKNIIWVFVGVLAGTSTWLIANPLAGLPPEIQAKYDQDDITKWEKTKLDKKNIQKALKQATDPVQNAKLKNHFIQKIVKKYYDECNGKPSKKLKKQYADLLFSTGLKSNKSEARLFLDHEFKRIMEEAKAKKKKAEEDEEIETENDTGDGAEEDTTTKKTQRREQEYD